MARFCTTCGKELRERDKFCIGCGTPVANAGGRANLSSGMPGGTSHEAPFSPISASSPNTSDAFGSPAYAPVAEIDTEADIAATEVWQVSVERTPGHADPFVVEMPKDEVDARKKAPAFGFRASKDSIAEDDARNSGPAPAPKADGLSGGAGSNAPEPVKDPVLKPDVQEGASFASPAVESGQSSGLFGSSASPLASSDGPSRKDAGVPSGATEGAGSQVDDDDDDDDESPTIVAQMLLEDDDDDEDDSPTVVVMRERYVLVRDEDGQRTELMPPCVLGRGRAADKRVKGNLAISRKHAKLFKEDGMLLIQDLRSTNGTFVNGEELEGDQCVPVKEGDAIRLGTEDFTLVVEKK